MARRHTILDGTSLLYPISYLSVATGTLDSAGYTPNAIYSSWGSNSPGYLGSVQAVCQIRGTFGQSCEMILDQANHGNSISKPLYLFLGWAVAIGGVTGLLLRITHQSLGQALEQSKSRRKARCKVERPPSLEQQTDEQSAMSTENHGSPSLGPHQSDGKASSRFSLSEFYTDWIDQDSPIASKDVDLISMTTIEEEDDYQDPAY